MECLLGAQQELSAWEVKVAGNTFLLVSREQSAKLSEAP